MTSDATPSATSRASDTRELAGPALALDALLDAVEELPISAEPQTITRRVVQALTMVERGARIGACIVDPRSQESFAELSLPAGTPAPPRDPTRLFPEQHEEIIIALDGLDGSTLHFSAASQPADSATTTVVRRAARVLARLLRASFDAVAPDATSSRLKAQLVQTEKYASFGRVVANVVHELANPLTSIIAYADQLRRTARRRSDGEDDLERIDRISESAQRILGLSRDLISYARPASAALEPVTVHDVIERALSFCEHELTSRSVEVVCDFAPSLPPVRGAAGPLVQVFVNLFTNAAHAMASSGGQLRVSSVEASDRPAVQIMVSDNGTGMDETTLGRIFDPFFTTKESDLGSGLGLVIVKEIVTAHGGAISAESALGSGTTFRLALPSYEAPRSTRRPTTP